ncbi:argininosuccinate lyase [Leptospira bandrabouensis]|uniref:argininosuccinate lyase n=1 Tax=Leptospira bandrabouensis TaxID=2484903 RepID=UPI001EE9494E|nr:argininosuccinate lyase [Leptospira bandrabouensis]MCG6145478.1 argininosuccinate lyase [Leptospira bandrabouensis]MCG6161102.1 argininosuccinate lyase [Leptospira bandrabouensis]MCG6164774.1 argininosuccinate lyase [Leptospira bandrabouensis]MCW7459159.1 argininosuccinate lyase [Leptospira bandrabouensis]MCW7477764.1 argininosuccinate lyase [Leptospira bandrabouensis]
MKEKKLWGGRFEAPPSSLMIRIGESISFDKELYAHDIEGSISHSRMLKRIGILTESEQRKIETGLGQIKKEIDSGKFEFKIENEDIHMSVESRLTELLGDLGKKLHTGRSRNDQVSQDVRLYIKSEVGSILVYLLDLLVAWVTKAEAHTKTIIPGYTHLQIAQPIRASHYFLSHFWANVRDFEDFLDAYERADELVLGSGALAGVNYSTDRDFLKKDLSLSRISENSMDAVSQRDHIFKFLFAASQFMIHASRFCEEIILYTSQEFNYFKLPDHLTTGSSIMPQKKNPDVAELIRGKAGRVIGSLTHLLVMVKGTPLSYNRDFQEDKLPLFDTVKQIKLSIEGVRDMVKGIQVFPENATKSLRTGFSTATDLADWLVSAKGIPFRTAHEIVGELVKNCSAKGYDLFNIPSGERGQIHAVLTDPGYEAAISLETSCDKKDVMGGTAFPRQKEQIKRAKAKVNELTKKLKSIESKVKK